MSKSAIAFEFSKSKKNPQETLKLEDEKDDVMTKTRQETLQGLNFNLDDLVDGKMRCAEHGDVALILCFECKEFYSADAFARLHARGRRADHVHLRTRPCQSVISPDQVDVAIRTKLCGDKRGGPCKMPAKVHCKHTSTDLCKLCFTLKHVKTLPTEVGEIPPERINYKQQLRDMLALITGWRLTV